MNILKEINVLRSVIMKGMAKNIGNSEINPNELPVDKNEIKRILLCRPNHRLGNQLLISPLVKEISETLPNCKIDLFVKGGLSPILFKNHSNVDKIIQLPKKHFNHLFQYFSGWIYIRRQRYDIVFNVTKSSSSGRLSTKFANGKYKFFGDVDSDLPLKHSDYIHIAKYPVYNFRYFLTQLGISPNETKVPPLNIELNASEISQGKKILQSLIKKEEKTICLFTYATADKCYSESWWATFYERLKSEYSDYNFIEVLPVENVSQINFKEPTFYSKEIREICAVIANCAVFIGADSGIMHLASASNTPTLGLFSVTNPDIYEPYNEGSKAIDTNKTSIDEMINEIDKVLSAEKLAVN